MKHTVALIWFNCLFFSNMANATLCRIPDKNITRVADYMQSLVDGIEHIKTALDAINKVGDDNPAEFFTSHKKGVENFDCAIKLVKPFADSKDEIIKLSSEDYVAALSTLKEKNVEMRNELKDALDGKSSKEGAGTRAERVSDRNIEIRKAWILWLQSIAMATHTVVDSGADEKSKAGRLKITSKESAEIIKKLKPLRKPNKDKGRDSYSYEIAADAIYKVLSGKWKFAEKPQE